MIVIILFSYSCLFSCSCEYNHLIVCFFCLGISGGVHLAFVIASVALWLGNYDILPIVFNEFPLEMKNDEAYLKAQVKLICNIKQNIA